MANAMKTASICLVSIVLGLLGCSENARPKLVAISGNDDMKFSVNKLDVKAGQAVLLTLTNVGELPKEAMSHNWVLLAKGTDARKLIEAGLYIRKAITSRQNLRRTSWPRPDCWGR